MIAMVNWENYEEYIVLLTDGELDEAGQKELEAFMQLHPEVREELAIYETVHLSPDETLVFGNKESLLRKEPKVIALNQWFRYGAAAGLIALIAFGIMRWQGNDTSDEIVTIDTAEHTVTPIVKVIDTALPTPPKQEVIVQQEEPKEETPKQEEQIIPVAPQKVEVVRVKEEKKMIQEAVPARLEIVRPEKMMQNEIVEETPVKTVVPELPLINKYEPAPEPDHNELLAWLPVDEDRREGLNAVGEAIAERIERVKEIRNTIKNTDVSVKLGNKELFVVRF